jgi:hypothetical protein
VILVTQVALGSLERGGITTVDKRPSGIAGRPLAVLNGREDGVAKILD